MLLYLILDLFEASIFALLSLSFSRVGIGGGVGGGFSLGSGRIAFPLLDSGLFQTALKQ